ncbi:hypothetical protein O181_131047 [Austropuccinia psidii MF-1]|uniref:Uncharacterized protein n=1 Tax=Austropuccinia psidii MF-1 TaxID=1389203 RepID=A0A9Q3L4Y2_9BASI|nr:hypothetical protein [Austropuccinia psidii MF-1]
MSQYDEQSAKQFGELEAGQERMKKTQASLEQIVKNLQEGYAQLSKASEETNNINKLFNVYHNFKPQPQGQVMENPYQPDYIKPDAMLMNKARFPSQYHDGDGISYSEKEALKQLPEASS